MDGSSVPEDGGLGESSVLPLYGAEGWETANGFVTSTGLFSLGEDDQALSLSVSGHQTKGEGLLEVTSHRRGRESIDELRTSTVRRVWALVSDSERQGGRAGAPQGGSAPEAQVVWTSVAIRVDGVPTDFAVASLEGGWAAVGEGPLSTIAIAARTATFAGIGLVRRPDPPIRRRRRRQRPPRPRSFPAEALTTAPDTLGTPNVDLTYADDRLTGAYRGLPIDIELHVPRSQSRTAGRFAGSDMAATWQLGSNHVEHPDVHSSLHGRFADQTVTVSGTFRLDEDWAIESAVITGQLGDQTIDAVVTAVDGGLSPTSTVAIDGHCAETTFALAVTIGADRRHAIVVGNVEGRPVRLDAHRRSGQDRRCQLTGRYDGPPVLLAFIAPTLLHFI